MERDGRVVKPGVDVSKDRRPAGAVFVGAPMPYYLQIAPSYGLHAGRLPGYPPLMDASGWRADGPSVSIIQ